MPGEADNRLLLVNAPPAPHGERIVAPGGGGVPARTSVPRIRALNIIPSELCNSRQHRQFSASRESYSVLPFPAKTSYRAADYTIRIMLSVSGVKVRRSRLRTSRARRRQERAWRQWSGCTRPFASPAPGSRPDRIKKRNEITRIADPP